MKFNRFLFLISRKPMRSCGTENNGVTMYPLVSEDPPIPTIKKGRKVMRSAMGSMTLTRNTRIIRSTTLGVLQ